MISCFSNSREGRIAAYLALTLSIMVLEFFYGYISNSLGLMSDSFHMLLDAVSLVVGLLAAQISRKSPNKANPFGYARYEVLCSFANGVLLIFIAFCVVVEAVARILSPPVVEGEFLLLVALVGLAVNIVGVLFFHDSCSHSHGGHGSHSDHNMRGIYLHILADLLGSVSVILSIFALWFGWWIADPICSFVSAVLIFVSAIPLVLETGKVLILAGEESRKNIADILFSEISSSCPVTDLQHPYVWIQSTAPHYLCICTLSARVRRSCSYTKCKNQITGVAQRVFFRELGVNPRVVVHLEE